MTQPTVDILMATYNGGCYLDAQIRSIQKQTYRDWHLLVSDDCSTDETLDIVKRFAAQDNRIDIISAGMRYGGSKQNFMHLLAVAKAPYVMFCDQDDVWAAYKVECELCVLQEIEKEHGHTCPIVVHSDLSLVDADCRPLGGVVSKTLGLDPRTASPLQVVVTGCATGCAMALNRACADKALRYRHLSEILMHDWWAALIASMLGVRRYIDEPLVKYRQHSDNVIGASISPLSETIGNYIALEKSKGMRGVRNRIVGDEIDRIRQAKEFLDCFGGELDPLWSSGLVEIAELPNRSVIGRLLSLIHI